jgi:hypothetical protein
VAAKLDHAGFESYPSAQAWLFEDHGQTLVRQKRMNYAALQLRFEILGKLKDAFHLLAPEAAEI